VERTSFDKLRIQRNANFDPEKVAKFIHALKSHVELANLKGLYDETKETVPEMRGPPQQCRFPSPPSSPKCIFFCKIVLPVWRSA